MRFRHKTAIAGLACFLGGWTVGRVDGEPTQLVFLSVGQGDCALFRTAGHTILIDDGPATPYADAGSQIVVPRLRSLRVENVDAILLSHPDEDHVGGTAALLNSYPQAKVVMSEEFEDDKAMLGHLHKWGLDPAAVLWLPLRSTLRLGVFTASLVCPDLAVGEPANNGSMFVRLEDGDASAVFSGDAPVATERAMESLGNWHSEILKAGHHGSRTASDESWIETVRPRYAVISVGRNNLYGHPNQEVLDRFQRDGVQVFRTDRDGDVDFDFDGAAFIRR